jgi:hypothetical protein
MVIQWWSSSSRGHAGPWTLIKIDDERRRHSSLHRGAASLSLALAVVPIADGEQRALHVDPEIDSGARFDVRAVHVAAEAVGDEGAAHLARGRGDPHRAEHGRHRQGYRHVGVSARESEGVGVPVKLADPRRVGSGSCRVTTRSVTVMPPKKGMAALARH